LATASIFRWQEIVSARRRPPRTLDGRKTRELLELLWVLEATVEREPEFAPFLSEVVSSEVFAADELPEPTAAKREPPKRDANYGQNRLHQRETN